MYNINMYQFQEKPYCNSGDYYIFPLNSSGVEKYNSKEGHPALYLNRLNPRIFQHILAKGTERTNAFIEKSPRENDCTQLMQQQNASCLNVSLPDKENKLSLLAINNPTATAINAINSNHQGKAHQHHHKKVFGPEANGIMPFELRFKQQKEYFTIFHRKMDFQDIFGYPQLKKKNSRKEIYEDKINSLKENLSIKGIFNDKSQGLNKRIPSGKSINGGILIPRINRRRVDKIFNPFNSLAMQLNRSLNIPHCNVLNDNESLNVLKQNNDDLKETLNQQTNNVFLKRMKLPSLSKVISTKKVISKSIGSLKDLGPKYNAESYSSNSNGRSKRNYIGGKYHY